MKELLSRLYWASIGFWFAGIFIIIYYKNPAPAWVAVIIMFVLRFIKEHYKG